MTKPILVFEDTSITVQCEPAAGIVAHEVLAFCPSATFMKALIAGVEAMRVHHATKWLSDDRRSGPLDAKQEEWGRHVWFPNAVAAGWKHWAVLQPESVLGRLSLQRRIDAYSAAGIQSKVFTAPIDAWGWLRTLP